MKDQLEDKLNQEFDSFLAPPKAKASTVWVGNGRTEGGRFAFNI